MSPKQKRPAPDADSGPSPLIENAELLLTPRPAKEKKWALKDEKFYVKPKKPDAQPEVYAFLKHYQDCMQAEGKHKRPRRGPAKGKDDDMAMIVRRVMAGQACGTPSKEMLVSRVTTTV